MRMTISDILLVLSLIGNIILVTYLGTYQKKVEDFPASVKMAEKISYNAGRIMAVRQAFHLEDGEPTAALYDDWCTKNAAAFSTMMVIQVK